MHGCYLLLVHEQSFLGDVDWVGPRLLLVDGMFLILGYQLHYQNVQILRELNLVLDFLSVPTFYIHTIPLGGGGYQSFG